MLTMQDMVSCSSQISLTVSYVALSSVRTSEQATTIINHTAIIKHSKSVTLGSEMTELAHVVMSLAFDAIS